MSAVIICDIQPYNELRSWTHLFRDMHYSLSIRNSKDIHICYIFFFTHQLQKKNKAKAKHYFDFFYT